MGKQYHGSQCGVGRIIETCALRDKRSCEGKIELFGKGRREAV
jgi:hypothetical protein